MEKQSKKPEDVVKGFKAKIGTEKMQIGLVIGLIIIGCLVIFALLYPEINKKIRQEEINNAYMNEYTSSKIAIIPYQTVEEEIKKSQQLIVLFQNDQMKNQAELRRLLNKKAFNEISDSIHVYPMIYAEKSLEQKYELQQFPVFIYFVDGKEQNRYVFQNGKISVDDLLVALENLKMQGESTTANTETTDPATQQSTATSEENIDTEYSE